MTSSILSLDAAASQPKPAGEIVDKDGFAARWGHKRRSVDNWLAQGLPHYRVGERRVRIFIPEADAWMREKFHVRRLGPLNGGGPQ
jgi:hypothetical protein